jgi:hypothetical protein
MGRPKSAAYRTADLVGLDTFVHVADNVYDGVETDEARDLFKAPDFLQQMVERGWLGNKAKQGFYKKEKTAEGRKILQLDWRTMEYIPKDKLKAEVIEYLPDKGELTATRRVSLAVTPEIEPEAGEGEDNKKIEPFHATCERMTFVRAKNRADFFGNFRGSRGRSFITSDTAAVMFADEGGEGE